MLKTSAATIDPVEIAKFARLAERWWDPNGPFAPLHAMNPCRLGFIREQILLHFQRADALKRPLAGLRALDIGCGGGLISEPMARLGAEVTGLDGAEEAIAAAQAHAAAVGLAIDYRVGDAETLAAAGETFDVVLALEIVEHVADLRAFCAALSKLTRPGGLLVISTINRTPQARALAIFLAERVLRWAEPGTHAFDKLVRPEELDAALPDLVVSGPFGMRFDPIDRVWRMGRGPDVNYFMVASKPAR